MDKMKKDFTPTLLDFGPLQIYLARHFGFCYGVENAIEIAFRTIEENPGKKIYLLSEMIHNPQVNADLQSHGVEFLQDTYGKQLISFDTITAEDIVLIPAFGTTIAIEKMLNEKGIPTPLAHTMLLSPRSRMDILSDAEIDGIVAKSKLVSKYNQVIDSNSAYEILTQKLEDAAQKTATEAEEKKPAKAEPGFFDNPIVKQVGRTAASVITRGLLGALGLGGRSSKRKSLF